MKSLSRYSFINAKIRACLSRFLKTSDWENLKACVAFDNFRLSLASTRYADIFGARGLAIDLDSYETKLDELLASDYDFVLKNTSGDVFEFVSLMQLSHKIAVFKRIFREFVAGDKEYITPVYLDSFPYELMHKETLEEFISSLQGTFFYKPLLDSLSETKLNKNTFLAEMNIDKAYYEKLWRFCESMPKKDKEITEIFLKLKTDVLNIKTIARMRKYLKATGGDMEKFLVKPQGSLDKNILGFLYDERSVAQTMLGSFGKYVPDVDVFLGFEDGKQSDSFLFFVDVFLNTALLEHGKKIIAGFPFSVSILWFFFLVNETEINNIRYIMRSVIQKSSDNLLESVLVDVGR